MTRDEERKLYAAVLADPFERWQSFIDDVERRLIFVPPPPDPSLSGSTLEGTVVDVADPPGLPFVPYRVRATVDGRRGGRGQVCFSPAHDRHRVIAVSVPHPSMGVEWRCAGVVLNGLSFADDRWVASFDIPIVADVEFEEDCRWRLWVDFAPDPEPPLPVFSGGRWR